MESYTLRVPIHGFDVDIHVEISNDWTTLVTFTFARVAYTFGITKWQARGFTELLAHIITHYGDAAGFGRIDPTDGSPFSDPSQRRAAVRQAVQDVFTTLDFILTDHGCCVLDYAVWYRETNKATDDYSSLITYITTDCIVNSNFMAPAVNWKLTKF